MMRSLAFALALAFAAGTAAAADVYTPGSDKDPRVRTAQFLAGNKRYLDAAAMLEQVQGDAPQSRLAPAFYRDLADDTLYYGMPARAEMIYREQAASSDRRTAARARLRLADFYYTRGYFQKSTAELTAVKPQIPSELLVDWQDLMSRVLMAQGRYGEAADILLQADSGPPAQTEFMHYNLGVALIKDGRVGQGVNMLDRVGRLTPVDSETLALRDKANLALGYQFLSTDQGGTAVPILGRVRSEGPYSTRALLWMGWAYLAPRGSRQKKVEVGDESAEPGAFNSFATIGVLLRPGYIDSDSIYRRAKLAPFHLSGQAANEEAQLKQALVPWVELVNRDPMDPAVQQGLSDIPYILDKLGAHIQAQQFYERAIAAMEETRDRLDQAERHVMSGRMVTTIVRRDVDAQDGWGWKLKDLPDAAETFYLQQLLAENNFQEALKNFRNARQLQRNLANWKGRLGELQQSYRNRSTQGAAAPAPTPAASYGPAFSATEDPVAAPTLQMANRLSGSDSSAPDAPQPDAPVALQLATSPSADRFVGPYERMDTLRKRIDALLPQLAAAEAAESKLLQDVAMTDLERQRVLNEKLLTEARFALARVYDRQLKGGN